MQKRKAVKDGDVHAYACLYAEEKISNELKLKLSYTQDRVRNLEDRLLILEKQINQLKEEQYDKTFREDAEVAKQYIDAMYEHLNKEKYEKYQTREETK